MLQASSVILAGLGLAAVGFVGRYVLRAAPTMSQKMSEALKSFPTLDPSVSSVNISWINPKHNVILLFEESRS